jgi:hypothetical protein
VKFFTPHPIYLSDIKCCGLTVRRASIGNDKAMAIEAAEHLKRKYPHSAVTVENLQTGEATAVEYKPDLEPR